MDPVPIPAPGACPLSAAELALIPRIEEIEALDTDLADLIVYQRWDRSEGRGSWFLLAVRDTTPDVGLCWVQSPLGRFCDEAETCYLSALEDGRLAEVFGATVERDPNFRPIRLGDVAEALD